MIRRRQRGGFTLIELLVTIGIIAILGAILSPMVASVKLAVARSVSGRSLRQLSLAMPMYRMDYDDCYPLAMYTAPEGRMQTWFGLQTDAGEFDEEAGLLAPYLRGVLAEDDTLFAKPYAGAEHGYGYNWGFLGSDFHLTGDMRSFPNCKNPAQGSQSENPGETIVFASSAFYNASWLPRGDGETYLFGFIDAPRFWNGNPNVDFRHGEAKKVLADERRVEPKGWALAAFADGSVRNLHAQDVRDEMFWRGSAPPSDDDF